MPHPPLFGAPLGVRQMAQSFYRQGCEAAARKKPLAALWDTEDDYRSRTRYDVEGAIHELAGERTNSYDKVKWRARW